MVLLAPDLRDTTPDHSGVGGTIEWAKYTDSYSTWGIRQEEEEEEVY